MGGFSLLWERPRPRLRLRSFVASPLLDPDPAYPLQDRFGNRELLRLLALSRASTGSSGTPAPAPASTVSPTVDPPAATGPATAGPPVAAAATERTPAEDVAPPQLALADPYANSYALSTDYALASRLLGFGFNALPGRLREPFPDAGRLGTWLLNPAARALIASPIVLAEIAAMTYSHEMGHYRADIAAGGNPDIDFPRDAWWAIWSGITYRNPTRPFTPAEELISEGAGVNQEQWNADYLFWDVARRGGGLSEAAAYFLARSNTFFYSALLPQFKGVTNFDDIDQYVTDLTAAGHKISRGDISWGSGLTLALSSGTLGAFRSLGRYLATGESRFKIPATRLGGLRFTWPDFHYLLSTQGPVFGGNALLTFGGGQTPLGVSLDVRPRTGGISLGAHLYDWRLGKRVRASPFAGLSADASLGPAIRLGTDLRILLPHGFQLIATPSYTFGSYLLDAERGAGGFGFNAAVGLPFR